MLRSLFASISGLRAHQTMMDVTANNIANVNTQGFKSSRAIFADALSQTVRGGGIPTDGTGSTNPLQVGLGTRVAAVNTSFTPGGLQLTGRVTDLAVQVHNRSHTAPTPAWACQGGARPGVVRMVRRGCAASSGPR